MFLMVDLKTHNKVKIEVVAYGQSSETSGWNFFGNYVNL